MPTIFIDENILLLKESLKYCGEIIEFSGRNLKNTDLINSNCEFLFVRSTTKVNSDLIQNTNLKFVATATAGVDHFDIQALDRNNVFYTSAPGCNANSVAEYIIYCILKSAFENNFILKDSTIGIIGFGHVGRLVAEYSYKIGLKVLINDPPLHDSGFEFPIQYEYVENINTLISLSDILTNHVPMINTGKYQTKYLLNSENLKLSKAGSIFLHASRGFVVEEKAVLDNYFNKNIKLFIDVYENEPIFLDAIVENAEIATPHVAGYSRNGKINGSLIIAEEFAQFSGIKPDFSIFEKELTKLNKHADNSFSNIESLYNILKQSRCIDYDSRDMKKLINLSDNEKKSNFDILRKNYPIRYETLKAF